MIAGVVVGDSACMKVTVVLWIEQYAKSVTIGSIVVTIAVRYLVMHAMLAARRFSPTRLGRAHMIMDGTKIWPVMSKIIHLLNKLFISFSFSSIVARNADHNTSIRPQGHP